jgi:hypothetical protein
MAGSSSRSSERVERVKRVTRASSLHRQASSAAVYSRFRELTEAISRPDDLLMVTGGVTSRTRRPIWLEG